MKQRNNGRRNTNRTASKAPSGGAFNHRRNGRRNGVPVGRRAPNAPPIPDLTPPATTRALLAGWIGRESELEAGFTRYLSLLLEANREFNLTAPAPPEEQWRRHVEDALMVGAMMEQVCGVPEAGTRLLDVGSGGGAPGLLWGMLWPAVELTLLEATGKKAEFLERAAERLEIARASVIHNRAEHLAHRDDHRERYDCVTARGLAVLPTLAEWTMPFAKIGGFVFAIKGGDIVEEYKSARRAFRLLGAPNPPLVLPYARPDGKACHLLIYRKTVRTPSPYPRRVGVAARDLL
jgi:16S rRNA (guanine527-N7)-methyltransferase